MHCTAHTRTPRCLISTRGTESLRASSRSFYLDSADKLAVQVQRGHAVLQHALTHDQHQVVPLALGDQLSAAEAGAAWQDLVKGGFLAGLIRCLIGVGKILMSQTDPAEEQRISVCLINNEKKNRSRGWFYDAKK